MALLAFVVMLAQVVLGMGAFAFLLSLFLSPFGDPDAQEFTRLFHEITINGLPLGWFLVGESVVWLLGYAAADAILGPTYSDEDTYKKVLWFLVLPFVLPFTLFGWLSSMRPGRGGRKAPETPRSGLSVVLVTLTFLIVVLFLARALELVK